MITGILYALVVFFAFSFIIIVHEFGHFIAGKIFKVRVEVFSLGMGKRLWGFKWGETDYRISLFPLGGYVAFAGVSDTEGDIGTGADYEFPSKPFWQRIIIAFAGPFMNIATGYLLAVLLFFFGVQFTSPVVGSTRPNSPAAQAELQPGDRVLKINGTTINGFTDIRQESALSDPGDVLTLIIERNGEVFERSVATIQPKGSPFPSIGINPVISGKIQASGVPGMLEAGFLDGDIVKTVNGVPLGDYNAYEVIEKEIHDNPGKEVTFVLLRDDKEVEVVVVPKTNKSYLLKFVGIMHPVASLAEGAPAEKAGILVGDIIVSINGKKLETWNDISLELAKTEGEVTVTVLRGNETKEFKLTPSTNNEGNRRLLGVTRTADDDPKMQISWVEKGSIAEEYGIKVGMPVKEFGIDEDGNVKITTPTDKTFTFAATEDTETPPWGHFVFGNLLPRQEKVRAKSIGEAFSRGFSDCMQIIKKTYLFLAKLLSAKISPTLMSGPVGIVHISYKVLGIGLTVFLHFLVLISINLAVVNLLPLPIVDGGNIVLLLIEGIKGSPVSQKVQMIIIYSGLVIIGGIFLMATANDIYRLIFGFGG